MLTLSPARKFLVALLTAGLVFLTAVNMPGAEISDALVTFIPAALGAVALYFTANTPEAPASKFLVLVLSALGVLVVFLVQHGTAEWRQALMTFAAAVVGAVLTYLTPNAGQVFPDAVPAHATTRPDAA